MEKVWSILCAYLLGLTLSHREKTLKQFETPFASPLSNLPNKNAGNTNLKPNHFSKFQKIKLLRPGWKRECGTF